MSTCPNGHESTATDDGDTAALAIAPGGVAPETAPPPVTWVVTVTADRGHYERVVAVGGPDAGTIEFPSSCPERRFVLAGAEMRVGRRSASRGLEPEIDMTGPPLDPGVSHLHAVLASAEDGTWTILDPGSSNGTQVNGVDITAGEKVPLHDGDRIAIGAWTLLTVHAA